MTATAKTTHIVVSVTPPLLVFRLAASAEDGGVPVLSREVGGGASVDHRGGGR